MEFDSGRAKKICLYSPVARRCRGAWIQGARLKREHINNATTGDTVLCAAAGIEALKAAQIITKNLVIIWAAAPAING
jgi:hypothetical protein